MRSRDIYVKLQKLKEEKEMYSNEEYQEKLLDLRKELIQGVKPDFETTKEEQSSLNNILGIG